jgi:hypothetical protein
MWTIEKAEMPHSSKNIITNAMQKSKPARGIFNVRGKTKTVSHPEAGNR